MKYILLTFILLFFVSCASKKLIEAKSATILIKTPTMKFYDKGFINRYEDHIHLQVFTVGQVVLDLKIYQDEVCQTSLQCISLKEFNSKYLHKSYKDDFLYNLFLKKKIYHKDKNNKILIKVK